MECACYVFNVFYLKVKSHVTTGDLQVGVGDLVQRIPLSTEICNLIGATLRNELLLPSQNNFHSTGVIMGVTS